MLSSDDPIRVFQQFSTLDNLSQGRAEIMAGRGSFIESFPLFGYDLDDYDELFSEKLELLLEARANEIVYWPGSTHTQRIENRGVYPRPIQDPLPVWIAVGGTPQSVVRAATLGLPMALAIIGGAPELIGSKPEIKRLGAVVVRRFDYQPRHNAYVYLLKILLPCKQRGTGCDWKRGSRLEGPSRFASPLIPAFSPLSRGEGVDRRGDDYLAGAGGGPGAGCGGAEVAVAEVAGFGAAAAALALASAFAFSSARRASISAASVGCISEDPSGTCS